MPIRRQTTNGRKQNVHSNKQRISRFFWLTLINSKPWKSSVGYWGQRYCHPGPANNFISLFVSIYLLQAPGDSTFLRAYTQRASMLARQQGHQCCRCTPCRRGIQSKLITACTGGSSQKFLMFHGFTLTVSQEWSTWIKLWIGLTLSQCVSFLKFAFPCKGSLKFACSRLTRWFIKPQ